MKVCLMLALVVSSSVVIANAAAVAKPANPVIRVVDLLKGLSLKVEHEGKVEWGLYEDFVCWGKSVISQKTASNEAAESEIEELQAWISELDNGAVELTDERARLDKEIGDLSTTLETETNLRDQEHTDFLKAEEDMELAIAALEKAIDVLSAAMAPPPTNSSANSSLLSVRAQVRSSVRSSGGLAALMDDAATVKRAVKLGDRFLNKVDANFLRRLLTGQVPKVNWKKLNRKATFKMKYKARSGGIMTTLEDMLATFQKNLGDAREKEAADEKAYDELHKAKSDELSSAQQARVDMVEENGAKSLSKEESEAQIKLLTTQINNDKKYIAQTQTALDEKKMEYKSRKALRDGELEAISKAISILHSDEARDLFHKSFESQGYLFLQRAMLKSQASTIALRWKKAAALLRNAGQITEDAKLLNLVKLGPNETKQIAPVITAIDSMIAYLNDEEAKDLQQKEQCEEQRAEDTRVAIVMARTIDEMTDTITKLTEEIADLEEKIAAAEKAKEETEEQLAEATAIRTKAHAEFQANKHDDVAAADLVVKAKEVLESFYTDNNLTLGLLQKGKQPAEPVAPGEAPTPPPATWEGGYMGASVGSMHIVASLEMIHEDILTDISKAEQDEAAALAEFEKFKKESEAQIEALEQQIITDTGIKGEKEKDKSAIITSRAAKKGDLLASVKNILAVAAAGCDYIAINYALRVKNRQIEMDSLNKAKAILLGGEFTAPDPNREIKPGDAAAAFLQHTGRSLRGRTQHGSSKFA